MTFLLDHCIWKETENILREAGFDCITLRELNKAGAVNGEVIACARSKKAVLITRDRDFTNLTLYPPGSHDGIIFLRITPESKEKVHAVMLEALRNTPPNHFKGNAVIITSIAYRIHR